MSTSERQIPADHRPEVEAIVDHDTMVIYEKGNMDEAWINSDHVVEVLQ